MLAADANNAQIRDYNIALTARPPVDVQRPRVSSRNTRGCTRVYAFDKHRLPFTSCELEIWKYPM